MAHLNARSLSGYSESQPSRMSQQVWQSRAGGRDLRVEVVSCDAMDQLHDVPVPDRSWGVTHHQLLPGEGTPKSKWLNLKWLNYMHLYIDHNLVMTKLLGQEAAGGERHLGKKREIKAIYRLYQNGSKAYQGKGELRAE